MVKQIVDPELLKHYLATQRIDIPLGELWSNPEQQRVSALCYVESENAVLMLQRWKEPFSGYWTAPGGKLQADEDPTQAVMRELHEETGLTLVSPRLQLITSETSRDSAYNWLLFVFRCNEFRGNVGACDEGELRWIPLGALPMLPIPDVDARLHPYIFATDARYAAFIAYNEAHQVGPMHVQPIPL